MKHRWMFASVLVLGLAGTALAEVQYVQVEKARLLSKPSAFAKSKTTLAYRTEVEVLGRQGGYCLVQAKAGKGYLPARSLSTQRPAFTAKLSKQYVSSDEVAMATKGFNAQVESEYRRDNPNLPYATLDLLETQTFVADPAAAYAGFRKAGRLGEFQPGGEAQ
jgi:hypothetical protein